MNELQASRICQERMQAWLKDMVELNCTPALAVGIGQGAQRGQLHLFAPDGMPDKTLLDVVNVAGMELKRRGAMQALQLKIAEVEEGLEPVGAGAR